LPRLSSPPHRIGHREPASALFHHQRDATLLWAGDIFALPSAYEVVPLAALEAGAAGLPLLAAELDGCGTAGGGETGYVGDRTGVSMAAGLRRFGSLPESRRQQMATAARAAAQQYGLDAFVEGWAKLYAGLETKGSRLDEDA
jgi:glycosyltransferase involved in cell wall biosynthesis